MIKKAILDFQYDKDKKPCLGWDVTEEDGSRCISGTAYDLEEAVLDLLESNGTIIRKFSRLQEEDRKFIVDMFKMKLNMINESIKHIMDNFYK